MPDNVNLLFILLVLVLGLVMCILSIRINKQIAGCPSTKLGNANRWGLVISVAMIASAISFFLCKWNSPASPSGSMMAHPLLLYTVFLLVLGIVLIVLGGVMSSEMKKLNCTVGKREVMGVWVMGIVLLLVSLGYMVMRYRKNISSGASRVTGLRRDGNMFGFGCGCK